MSDELIQLERPTLNADFLKIYNRLCVAFRETPDESGVTQNVYFSALKDLPIQVIVTSAESLMRDSDCTFFPKTSEWRAAAEAAYRDQLRRAVQPRRDEPWHYECDACDDTGWIGYDCPDALCERKNPHAPHHYVRDCSCRASNRTYRRRHAFGGV